MNIVENWRKVWRSTTVLLSVLLGMLSAAQATLPAMQAVLSPRDFAFVSLGLAALIAGLRYVAQPALKVGQPDDQPPTDKT